MTIDTVPSTEASTPRATCMCICMGCCCAMAANGGIARQGAGF